MNSPRDRRFWRGVRLGVIAALALSLGTLDAFGQNRPGPRPGQQPRPGQGWGQQPRPGQQPGQQPGQRQPGQRQPGGDDQQQQQWQQAQQGDFFGQGNANDFFNLGPIGAMGMPDGSTLTIHVVEPGSRAEKAGLKVGDVITGAAGKPFRTDPLMEYADAFDKEEEKARPKLKLTLEDREIEIDLNKTGRSNDLRPGAKADEALKAACEFLASKQAPDGSFPTALGGQNGLVVVTSLAGMALLGSGDAKYRSHIDKAINFVVENAGRDGAVGSSGGRAWPRQQGMSPEEMREWMERMRREQGGSGDGAAAQPMPGGSGGSWDQTNWGLSYAAWFLASAHTQRANPRVREKLQTIATTLIENQVKGGETGAYEKGGGWAHGPARLGPNALNYLELQIMSNFALPALAFAKSCGAEVPDEPMDKAIAYILDCTTPRGGTAYSTRRGQFPGTAEPGRTSGALFALTVAGHRGDTIRRMQTYVRGNMERIPFGHGSPTMHLLAGALAANVGGGTNFRDYWRAYRLRIMLNRAEDGSIRTFPTEESKQIGNTDITVGAIWTTANQALILALHKGQLPLLNGDLRTPAQGAPSGTGR